MYIQESNTENPNPGNLQEITNLLSIILLMYPSIRGANFGLAKRCLSGWRTLYPSKSYATFTRDIYFARASARAD